MKFCIDWFSFTIKPDKNSDKKYAVKLGLIFKMLGANKSIQDSFYENDLGQLRFYDHCYSFNGISVYSVNAASDEVKAFEGLLDEQYNRYLTYGINVEMKGSGCRYYESLMNNEDDCWLVLFQRLLYYVAQGCSLHICRIDFAFDWKVQYNELKEQLLDLDRISSAMNSKYSAEEKPSYVSLFRSSREVCSYDRGSRLNRETGMVEPCKVNGRSIYFGSFNSDSFCRFYDKLSEQSSVRKDDPLFIRDELGDLESWVRFEIVFKNDVAQKIVCAFAHMAPKKFKRFLAELINSYIRFVEGDCTRDTRSTCSDWWADFIGTVEHAKITVVGTGKDEFNSTFGWILKCSNTFNAVIDNIGVDEFVTAILNTADKSRYTAKQKRIAASPPAADKVYTNLEVWQRNRPIVSY